MIYKTVLLDRLATISSHMVRESLQLDSKVTLLSEH